MFIPIDANRSAGRLGFSLTSRARAYLAAKLGGLDGLGGGISPVLIESGFPFSPFF